MKTSDKWSSHAIIRAWFVCILFSAWALVVMFVLNIKPEYNSILVFYILLLINTFFSIRVFASITPRESVSQQVWDFMLVLCLISLPITFADATLFVSVTLLLFVVATLKYIFLIPLVGFSKLFFQKVRVDTLGILFSVLCLMGIMVGKTILSLNLWAFIFLIANIYVLWHKPLYNLEHHLEKSVKK